MLTPHPCQMAAPSPCFATLPKLSGWRRPVAIYRQRIPRTCTLSTSIQGYAGNLVDSTPETARPRAVLKSSARISAAVPLTGRLAHPGPASSPAKLALMPSLFPRRTSPRRRRKLSRDRSQSRYRSSHSGRAVPEAPTVLADREAIHQVFSNLIDNALKYGASGGRIVLGARPVPHAVRILRSGFRRRIASEHLPRLFEPSYRVDKAASRESGGTGSASPSPNTSCSPNGGSSVPKRTARRAFLFTLPAARPPFGLLALPRKADS